MHSDPLQLLQVQRDRVDQLRAELAREQHKLEGMEEMFGAFPTPRRRTLVAATALGDVSGPPQRHAGGSAGRQPGSISKRWREVLAELWRDGKPFGADRAAEAVRRLEDRVIKPSEAKRILESHEEHGYVVRTAGGDFIVTDEAAKKFDFARGGDNTGGEAEVMTTNFDELLGGPEPQAWPQARGLVAPSAPPARFYGGGSVMEPQR